MYWASSQIAGAPALRALGHHAKDEAAVPITAPLMLAESTSEVAVIARVASRRATVWARRGSVAIDQPVRVRLPAPSVPAAITNEVADHAPNPSRAHAPPRARLVGTIEERPTLRGM